MRHLCVLGSTGSIGVSTLDVVRRHPELFSIQALTAHSNVDLLAQQCLEFKPELAVVGSELAAQQLKEKLTGATIKTQILFGPQALIIASTMEQVDTVMAAIVGAAGLMPTIEAAKKSKRILLANKESLVMSGDLFMQAIKDGQAELLPIDSEHNAIYQSLPDANTSNGGARGIYRQHGVKEILLTASGGPFRNKSRAELATVTPEQACAHPNWVMGKKISVDSATMMNKGLEVIEAHYLFGVAAADIKVLIHPQSVIHSMVRYIDGSVIAQLGQPDMRTPIAYGLGWPNRIESGVKELDFFAMKDLSFEEANLEQFPCLRLAYQALELGGTMPCILNAANEVAVEGFLNGGYQFIQISEIVERVLNQIAATKADSIETILSADAKARELATQIISRVDA